MGPFPHSSLKSTISEENPIGTDGFEFVEFSHQDPLYLSRLFENMGFTFVAQHKNKKIQLWRQGDVNYILNNEPQSHAALFAEEHGPCAASMAWRVVDAQHAFEYAISNGAMPYTGEGKVIDAPAIVGIGGSLLYFVDRYHESGSPYDAEFEWLAGVNPKPKGLGFYYLDHLTHNVYRGNMDTWWDFYHDLFGFTQIHFFNIEGKMTGLISRAITSPCGKIRIPLNESTDDKSQIEAYLHKYKGEGIQHVALGTDNIYNSTDALAANGVEFMPKPPDAYYDLSYKRVNGHQEPVENMKQHGILIDGEGVFDTTKGDRMTRILLQVFSKTVVGPIFFEFIQRKGDQGFGEGNFQALFESIEEEQIRAGELSMANTL